MASRRAAEEWIKAGRVSVNGQVVTEMGAKVDPARDVVQVDGRLVKATAAGDRDVAQAVRLCLPPAIPRGGGW